MWVRVPSSALYSKRRIMSNLSDHLTNSPFRKKVILLDCEIKHTEDGFQATCPHCPWTSDIRETKEWCVKAYYRHIAYIMNKLGGV